MPAHRLSALPLRRPHQLIFPRVCGRRLATHSRANISVSMPPFPRRGTQPVPSVLQVERCHLSLLSVGFRHKGWAFSVGGTFSPSPLFSRPQGKDRTSKQPSGPRSGGRGGRLALPRAPAPWNKEPGIIHSLGPSARRRS